LCDVNKKFNVNGPKFSKIIRRDTQTNRHDDTFSPHFCERLKTVVYFGRVIFAFQTEVATAPASLMWFIIIALRWLKKKQIRNYIFNIFFKNKHRSIRACYKLH
jgi:hypothetical protein